MKTKGASFSRPHPEKALFIDAMEFVFISFLMITEFTCNALELFLYTELSTMQEASEKATTPPNRNPLPHSLPYQAPHSNRSTKGTSSPWLQGLVVTISYVTCFDDESVDGWPCQEKMSRQLQQQQQQHAKILKTIYTTFKTFSPFSRKQLSMIVIHGFKISYFYMVVILLNDAGCDAKQVSMATVSINLMA